MLCAITGHEMGPSPTDSRPLRQARVAATLLGLALIAFVIIATQLGSQDTGYSPLTDSMSRLGERGVPGGAVFDIALAIVALALGLGAAVIIFTSRPLHATGMWIGLSAGFLLAAALVPTGNSLSPLTSFHRGFTAGALAALVLAALAASRLDSAARAWRQLAVASAVVGWAGLAGLVAGIGLLVPGFPAGLWERFLFGLTLVWAEALLSLFAYSGPPRSAANAAS